jgi:hypothetical protein
VVEAAAEEEAEEAEAVVAMPAHCCVRLPEDVPVRCGLRAFVDPPRSGGEFRAPRQVVMELLTASSIAARRRVASSVQAATLLAQSSVQTAALSRLAYWVDPAVAPALHSARCSAQRPVVAVDSPVQA